MDIVTYKMAQKYADTVIQSHQDISGKQDKIDNNLSTINKTVTGAINEVNSIAKGANQALSYGNYQTMITAFNALANDVYNVGQNVMIITLEVPDLWISSIESTSQAYTYTTDEAFTTALSTNGYVQVGYYKLSALETQKVDLTDYYTKTGTENKIEDYLYQIMPTDSASGEIATIDDATTMFNAIDVSGTIEPVQDLHGYDNLWPAGGGKNLVDTRNLDVTVAGIHCVSDSDGVISLSGTKNSSTGWQTLTVFTDFAPGNYVFSSNNQHVTCLLNWTRKPGTFTVAEGDIVRIVLFNIDAGDTLNDTGIKVQIESGSTATDWTPYSNICPITGWTGAKVTRCGKNLLDNSIKYIASPTIIAIGNNNDFTIDLKAGTYTLSVEFLNNIHYGAFMQEKEGSEKISIWNPTSEYTSKTFTVSKSGKYKIWLYKPLSVSANDIGCFQLELGSTATPYEPYQSETYNITFPTEAGTVYGGSLDVTTGLLTVDRAYWTKNTSTMDNADSVPGWKNSGICGLIGAGVNTEFTNQIMNIGKYWSANTNSTNDIVFLKTARYNKTQTEWQALAIDVQILVPLATPQTYQLTPQQISFLLGTNNLWVDTGDINVTYKADIQKIYRQKDKLNI